MTGLERAIHQVWTCAELWIGFHRDQDGTPREKPCHWRPNDSKAAIDADTSIRETYVLVKASSGASEEDVRIDLAPDLISLSRCGDVTWQRVKINDHAVAVEVAGLTLRINHDGSVTRDDADGTTWLERDGSIIKTTDEVTALMSCDGVEMSRRTPTGIAAIGRAGVLFKERDDRTA